MNGARPSLVRGSMMIATSLAIAGILTFVVSVIIARSVSVDEFGFYSITISLQGIAVLFSSFSLGTAAAKFVAEYIVRDFKLALKFARIGFQLVLVFATATAIVYFFLADLIGNGLYKEPEVAGLIPYSAMVAFSQAILILTSGVAQGNQRLKLMSAMQVSVPIISLLLIIMLLPTMGVKAAFLGLFFAQIVVAMVSMVRLSGTGFRLNGRIDAATEFPCSRILLSFAVPSVMSAILVLPVFWFGNTILTLESGFTAMGHFGVAIVFFQAISMLATSVSIPLIPRVSEMSVHSEGRIGALISKSIRTVSFLFFPLFFAVALFSSEIVEIMYGAGYFDATDAAYLMVMACYYYAVAIPIGAAIIGLGRMWVGLGLNMVWAASFVVLVLLLAPSYGPTGLGVVFAVSYVIHVVTSTVVANVVLKIRIPNILVAIVASVALFSAASPSLIEFGMGVDELSVPLKLSFLAAGTGLALSLGRIEFRMVLDRILKRGRDST